MVKVVNNYHTSSCWFGIMKISTLTGVLSQLSCHTNQGTLFLLLLPARPLTSTSINLSPPSTDTCSSKVECSPDPTTKQKLVILGTGWGSYSVLKSVKRNKSLSKRYSVVVISPRNHFLFTPLLASTTVGTLEFRSIIEPVRNAGFSDEHNFHLSYARELDVEGKVLHCESALALGNTYQVPYDKLVIGVGAVANDFGIPGVKEHAYFLREIADARAIRNKILTNFELATQIKTSLEERKQLLHFVIVGGGPTGVEFGGEFYDFLMQVC